MLATRLRPVATLAAAALAAGLVVTLPSPALAAGNALLFDGGQEQVIIGPNAALYIDGTITYDLCTPDSGATPDFVYPVTDVYVVHAGSAGQGQGLVDASGGDPNTIVGTSGGAFLSELIAVTSPSGQLGAGRYDVVFDTCQDGVLGTEDAVFPGAVTVELPDGDLPPPDGSIAALKDSARLQYLSWLQFHTGLIALMKYEDALSFKDCLLEPSPDCLKELLETVQGYSEPAEIGDIKGQTLDLVANQAKNYGAIWQDPPNPDFAQATTAVSPPTVEQPLSGSPVGDALGDLVSPLANEVALSQALLTALERYQGAQAAGDETWALTQARSVRDLASSLREHVLHDDAVDRLKSAVAADADGIERRAAAGAQLLQRIQTSGLSHDERRLLANRGYDLAAIAAIENRIASLAPNVALSGEEVVSWIDGLVSARAAGADALESTRAGWDALASSLAPRVAEPLPEADAGGPYSGTDIVLDGAASVAPAGSTYAWDLDLDGAFDDAEGATPAVRIGDHGTLGLRVTDVHGRASVDYARMTPTAGNGAPVIAAAPAEAAMTVVAGQAVTLTADATEPDGDALAWSWTVGGEPVDDATSASFTYAPTGEDVGTRAVTARVSAGGRSAIHSWVVSVVDVDSDLDGWTRGPDCDDTRNDTRPGAFERLGNGRDDDCDAGTPDAPAGGLTGSVQVWGSEQLLPRLAGPGNLYSPTPFAGLGDDVMSVEMDYAGGFAVHAEGGVTGWGTRTGSGTFTWQESPVAVHGLDGEAVLTGVSQVAAGQGTVYARRGSDGSVVAWGDSWNGQVGDGTTNRRTTPVRVIEQDGTPLKGVASVETGGQTAYAVMADGTVRNWGVEVCDATVADTVRLRATPNPRFGGGVVQAASGHNGGVIVRKNDGSAWACGPAARLLGRGTENIPFTEMTTPRPVLGLGAGSGVVDISYGGSSASALTADGSVWLWGENLNGALTVLGLPHGAAQLVPARVPLPDGPPVVDLEMDSAGTTFLTRADGSVLVYGANVFGGGGIGSTDYVIAGTPEIDLGETRALAVANSEWAGMALVRPADDPDLERPAPWVEVSVEDARIEESGGGTVRVSLSEPAPSPVEVGWTVPDGPSGTATIAAGDDGVDLAVQVPDDQLDENDEQRTLTLTAVSDGLTVVRRTGVLTVVDDDEAPRVSVAGATVQEGGTSLTDVALDVSLSAPSAKQVQVSWSTADGTAVAGDDYTAASGLALLPPGTTSARVHVAVHGDAAVEPHERFVVRLEEPLAAELGAASAQVQVVDDEPLLLDVVAPSVDEGAEGTTEAPFAFSLTAPPAGTTVTVPWSVVGGTADVPGDVLPTSGEITFDAATTSATVVTQVVGGTEVENLDVETFRLALGPLVASDGRVVVPADTATAIVREDDAVPATEVDAGPAVTGTEGASLPVSGSVSAGAASVWTVSDDRCTVADPNSPATTVTCRDETEAVLTLTADDGSSDSTPLTVANAAPAVTIVSPISGTSVHVGVPLEFVAEVDDQGTDDVLSCRIAWGDGTTAGGCTGVHSWSAAGSHTVRVTVTDADGGVASADVEIVVSPPWPFEGFFAPVENPGSVNTVKAGSAVPLKFSLGGDRGLEIFAAGMPASAAMGCAGAPHGAVEPIGTPGSSRLTYDRATGRYHLNWKTSPEWAGTCRRLLVRLVDGTERTADFRFR